MSKKTEYIILLIWLLISVPMIFFSYGSDPDSGRLAEAARKIWEYGKYFKSRTSGFPLYEIAISPLVAYGQWYLSNFLSVVFGFSSLLSLLSLAKKQEFKSPVLVVLSIAFAPIFIKNSTSTMDYMSALAFLAWAYTYMRQDKYFLAALLVGVAAGFRPVNSLFIIPILLYIWINKKDFLYILKVYLLAFFVGVVSCMPAILTVISDLSASPPHSESIYRDFKSTILAGSYNFLEFFGIAASMVIYPSLAYVLFSRRALSSFDLFHFSNILLWIGMFIYMPYESEYLLPMLFSIIFILDKYLKYKYFIFIVVFVLSFHVVKLDLRGGKSGKRYIKLSIKEGYTISDIRNRMFLSSLRDEATNLHVEKPTLLTFKSPAIVGANSQWEYDEQYQLYKQKDGLVYLPGPRMTCEKFRNLYDIGFKIVVWTDMKSKISKCPNWTDYTEQINSLDAYFGNKLHGKSSTSP